VTDKHRYPIVFAFNTENCLLLQDTSRINDRQEIAPIAREVQIFNNFVVFDEDKQTNGI
jgi:hypothetical protein